MEKYSGIERDKLSVIRGEASEEFAYLLEHPLVTEVEWSGDGRMLYVYCKSKPGMGEVDTDPVFEKYPDAYVRLTDEEGEEEYETISLA